MSDFRFYIPSADVIKSTDTNGNELMKFRGIASTPDKDSQGEYLDPSTFDLREDGIWVNYNHGKDPSDLIGVVTKSKITPKNELAVEGVLFPGISKAESTWKVMKALNDTKSKNKLGISVEGQVIERDPFNKNVIKKAKITHIALCPVPINGKTWADISKGHIDNNINEQYSDDSLNIINMIEKVEFEKPLLKSDVYAKIFEKTKSTDQTKLIYPLIEKISIMNNTAITEDTLKKAFEILGIASLEVSKDKSLEKGEKETKKEEKEEEKEEDDDKEMVEKAMSCSKDMMSKGLEKDEVKKSLVKKGYGESVINKAMSALDEMNANKDGGNISEIASKEVKKSFDSLNAIVDQKTNALGLLIKSQSEENEILKQSIVELKKALDESIELNKKQSEQFNTFLNSPVTVKTKTLSKSFQERFAKSDNGERILNINNSEDKRELGNILEEISKGDFNSNFYKAACDLETVGGILPNIQKVLAEKHKIIVVKE